LKAGGAHGNNKNNNTGQDKDRMLKNKGDNIVLAVEKKLITVSKANEKRM